MTLFDTCRPAFLALLAVGLGSLPGTAAPAQDYPNKPVKIIVPCAPGGGTDMLAPLIG